MPEETVSSSPSVGAGLTSPPTEPDPLARGIRQAMGLAALMCASLGGYLLILKWRGPAARLTTYTPLDDLIPFQPAWVWVYLIPYLVGPVLVGFLTPATFRWFISRSLTVVVLAQTIFIVLPTQTAERPQAALSDGLTARLYQEMIAIDEPPANAAPSLHVSLTFLLALAWSRDFRRWCWLALLAAMLVWLSTLLTRQHHLVDVVTGVMLATLVVCAWPPWKRFVNDNIS
jgi:membrane-associated phospholipid phosphatase